MEEPVLKGHDLQLVERKPRPVIDVSFVELQERITHRIFNASNVLGTIALLAMITAPGAVEGEMYITAVVLVVIFAVCANLSIREDGKRK